MHIKKQEMFGFSSIQKKDNEQLIEQERIPLNKKFQGEIDQINNRESPGLNRIRGQVLALHDELKEIQTKISSKQIQAAFLENSPADPDWKSRLESFMKGQFPDSNIIKPDPDLKTYLNKLREDMHILTNDMQTREIKLENIISSGLLDAQKTDVSDIIIKDMDKAKEVFSRMKVDSISRILKS